MTRDIKIRLEVARSNYLSALRRAVEASDSDSQPIVDEVETLLTHLADVFEEGSDLHSAIESAQLSFTDAI